MNPFQPSFGKNPPQLIGRELVLTNFIDGLDASAGDERRTTFFTGLRGMGKTVVLNNLAKRAKDKAWIVAEVSTSKTMLKDILDQIVDQTRTMVKYDKRDVTGFNFSIFGIGAGLSTSVQHLDGYGWRMQMTKILDELQKKQIGVLFTVDEVQSNSEELREFALAYQHFVREDRQVAVALAGLPFEVSDLLNNRVLTFLRRSNRVVLSNVTIDDVRLGLLRTIEDNSRTITPETLDKAALATDGYPYLIQLVGSRIWEVHPLEKEISDIDVEIGVPMALNKLYENIIEPMLNELSKKDLEFLQAMSCDEGSTDISDLVKRLNASQSYLSQYRKRLIDAKLIYSPTRGVVVYAIPYMRNYFLQNPYRVSDNCDQSQ
jgi:type II secretory pathway predicted ATPase ExeA